MPCAIYPRLGQSSSVVGIEVRFLELLIELLLVPSIIVISVTAFGTNRREGNEKTTVYTPVVHKEDTLALKIVRVNSSGPSLLKKFRVVIPYVKLVVSNDREERGVIKSSIEKLDKGSGVITIVEVSYVNNYLGAFLSDHFKDINGVLRCSRITNVGDGHVGRSVGNGVVKR
jgi:hypothetical protein